MQKKNGERQGGQPYSIIISADADPEGWLKARQKLLTATDIPSILGVPGARSALETWYAKKDALVASAESEAIREARRAGHDFEDFNALMFAKATGRHVERSQQLLRSAVHPWLGATLDYTHGEHMLDRLVSGKTLRSERRPLELKNAGSHAADDMWPFGGEPHLTWQVQVIVQCVVLDTDSGSLSAWLGSPFVHHRWCDIERDAKLEEIIVEEGGAFWKSLKRKSPPKDPDPKIAYEVLRRLSPALAKRKVISLPKAATEIDRAISLWASECDRLKENYDLAKSKLEMARADMAALIGEHDGGKLPSGDMWTFKHVHVPTHQVAAHSYRRLNRVSAAASKPRKTTWKTSK